MSSVIALCFSRTVIRRAAYSALVVGSILIIINHSDVLMRGEFGYFRLFQMVLTMIVPYIVSTVSSVTTIMELRKEDLIGGVNHE